MLRIGYSRTIPILLLTLFWGIFPKAYSDHVYQKSLWVPIPGSLPKIWAYVLEKQEQLDRIMKSRDFKANKIHEIVFSIRDLVAAMPRNSKSLSQKKLRILKKEVGDVDLLADHLDETADSRSIDETSELVDELNNELKKIEKIYPAGLLK